MNKTMKRMIIIASSIMLSLPVLATDGAIAAWRRDSSGTLTSGVDKYGKIVLPDKSIGKAELTSAVQSSLDDADTALQPITWTVGVVTSSLSAKVTLTSSQSAAQFITGWISEESGGTGVGTNVTSMVIDSDGVLIAGGSNEDAYGIFTTETDGTAVFDVTIKAAQDGLFFNVVQNNNVVVSEEFDITED